MIKCRDCGKCFKKRMEIAKLAIKTLNELKCEEIHIMPFMEWLRLKNDALKTEEWPIGI